MEESEVGGPDAGGGAAAPGDRPGASGLPDGGDSGSHAEPVPGWSEPVPRLPGADQRTDQPSLVPDDPIGAPSATAPIASVVPVWGPVATPAAAPEPTAPPRRTPGWTWPVVAVVAALVGGLIGGGIVASVDHSSSSTTVKEISAGPALLNGTTNIEAVIDKVLPAVVSIDATATVPAEQSLFGGSTGGGVQEDQGTGMIITANGEVITNNHVIAGATTIRVTLYGKLTSLPATLVDTDPVNDIALLQITGATNLPTVSYGDSKNVQVGDAVVAIGNALGLQAGSPSVTQGIISATGRTVEAGDNTGTTTETLTNMFQTDAAINPGNSGGPLVDSSGRVIGMNTAVAASEDGTSEAQNIGFAIPSNKIGKLLPALRSKSIGSQHSTSEGFLGVGLETLTSQLRSEYNFVPTQGAVVLQVQAGSPADIAGLQQGDVITTFQGKPVTSADQLATAIQGDKPGQTVTIGLYRGQDRMTVTATLGADSAAASNG
jgi:S1-C subfamily serine protease